MNVQIRCYIKKGHIYRPVCYNIANLEDVAEALDSREIDFYDYLDIKGIGTLFIRDIRTDGDDTVIIDTVHIEDSYMYNYAVRMSKGGYQYGYD